MINLYSCTQPMFVFLMIAKFNCTVPGTVTDFNIECNIVTIFPTTTQPNSSILIHIVPTVTHTVRSNFSPSFTAVNSTMPDNHPSKFSGSIPFNVTISFGVVLVILLLTIVGCALFVSLIKKRKKIKSITSHSAAADSIEHPQQTHNPSRQALTIVMK